MATPTTCRYMHIALINSSSLPGPSKHDDEYLSFLMGQTTSQAEVEDWITCMHCGMGNCSLKSLLLFNNVITNVL